MSFWGHIVASNLLIACCIGGIALCVGRGGRRASVAHGLWLLFFVKLVTPPLFVVPIDVPPSLRSLATRMWSAPQQSSLLVSPTLQETGVSPTKPLVVTDRLETQSSPGHQTGGWPTQVDSFLLLRGLCFLWLLGVVIVLTCGAWKYLRFHLMIRAQGKDDTEATVFVHRLIANSGSRSAGSDRRRIRRSPRVLHLPMNLSPMLCCLGRDAIIVCSEPLWKSLNEVQRTVLLAHEAAHYQRRDHWVRWLEWLVAAVYWWFPGVYFARRQLERHEEACCDRWAVRQLEISPRQYGEALLNVVDFVCEHRATVPRLASGMQPTDSLAERLRLLRFANDTQHTQRWPWVWRATAILLLVITPLAQPQDVEASLSDSYARNVSKVQVDDLSVPHLPRQAQPMASARLPSAPVGFWNHVPQHEWANDSISLTGAKWIADVSTGIRIEIPGRSPLVFANDQFSSFVDLKTTGRMVIGDRDGNLRLWDLLAGVPVSLIGKHQSTVTSMAYRDGMGFWSSDLNGAVIEWDLQSGSPLQTWSSSSEPVQSIRLSNDGETLAVLLGSWQKSEQSNSLIFLDSRSLQPQATMAIAGNVALVLHAENIGWIAITWSGDVHLLDDGTLLTTLPKDRVTALLTSQDIKPIPPHHSIVELGKAK